MQPFLANLPNVTMPEMIVLAAAALFLTITPAAVAWSDAMRRRRALAASPVGGAAATASLLPPLPAPVLETPLLVETMVAAEEIEAPAASPDILSDWDAAPAYAASEETAKLAPDDVDVVTAAAPAALTASQPQASMELPAAAEAPPSAQWVSVGPLAAPEPAADGARRFQLLELRQARLATWPPAAVWEHPEHRRLWEEGERLAAKYDREISSATLSWSQQLQSTAYGGVDTDGTTYRLRFLLFEEMWPPSADQAQAAAIFEIAPTAGVSRSWVQAR
jgi:hypothetical protein